MTIEQKIFRNKRFDTSRMEDFGFQKKEASFLLERELPSGGLTAEITVYGSGNVRGRVFDRMSGEEYVQLRMPNVTGAFVGSVREAYEELLSGIAEHCCTDVAFTSDQSNRIAAAVYEKYSIEPDFPWDNESYGSAGVFRHSGSRKWFGLIMDIDRRLLDKSGDEEMVDVLNLKADETGTEELLKRPGVFPAYHMNHSKWISVVLDDSMNDDEVMRLVDESYRLTSGPAGVLNEKLIREVLAVADSIPAGRVMSYGQIAKAIGRPRNSRLVGKIMSLQDTSGEHPCHRVVNSAGRTVPGWTEQRRMLEAEGVSFRPNGNVDMKKHAIER